MSKKEQTLITAHKRLCEVTAEINHVLEKHGGLTHAARNAWVAALRNEADRLERQI